MIEAPPTHRGHHAFGDLDHRALAVAAAGAAVLTVVIYVSSGRLRSFDPALVGYATATVFLAFGAVYRLVVWCKRPPTRRYVARGWQAMASRDALSGSALLVLRTLANDLVFQSFIRRRGLGRWLAHQALFWGVTLAAAVTFPLTFGWIAFEAVGGTESGYAMYMLGTRVARFDALSLLGWATFHVLDGAAVLVIAGCAYFLWRRHRDRAAMAGHPAGHHLLPLLALLAVSVTGLLLTFSTAFLEGRYYHFLALVHMATVVLTLVAIPFGKLFHPVQRAAVVGVPVYKRRSLEREGAFHCRRCTSPIESAAFVENLASTMGDVGLGFPSWIETCPRCKRVERGLSYQMQVKEGFR